ncbi:protein FAR1-RELATED SEQUENCE 5-like [Apium graveolens]|uniref:protein FAR1-RELATED SEQUENCE 5-like n=1 Tax=Apium graveolens TaxID=4045 RepID=UPI003D7B5D7D
MWAKKCRTIEQSEECWSVLCEKYKPHYEEPLTDSQKNIMKSWKWIVNMYVKRHHWVKAYLKDTFFAGMKSSQRSESMNSFFDGYVNSNTLLSDFVDQYEKAIASRRDTEEKEDLISMTTTPDLTNMHSLEAHAGKIYSRNIFKLFQNEFMQILHCQHSKKVVIGVEMVYDVTFKDHNMSHIVKIITRRDLYEVMEREIKMWWNKVGEIGNKQMPPPVSVSVDDFSEVNITDKSPQEMMFNFTISDPKKCKTKGRPRNASRIPTGMQQSQDLKQKRVCGSCGQKGHYKSTCKNSKQ